MPATVVVVTTYVAGRPWGITASTFTSVTLAPPTVSVSLFSHTATVDALRLHGVMGVSVLSAEQVDVARTAATPGQPKFLERFTPEAESSGDGEPFGAELRFDPQDGVATRRAPSVHGAVAHFACRVSQVLRVGDHDVFIARVEHVQVAPGDDEVLVYAHRSFHSLTRGRLEG